MDMVTCKCGVCQKEFRVDKETLDNSPPGCSLGMRLERILEGFRKTEGEGGVIDVQIIAQVIPEQDTDLCYECSMRALKFAVDEQFEGD